MSKGTLAAVEWQSKDLTTSTVQMSKYRYCLGSCCRNQQIRLI